RTFGKSHVEVMLGDEIEIHARLIGAFDDFQMALVKIDVGAPRRVVLLHVIEESEFHARFPFYLGALISFCISCSRELSCIFSTASFFASALCSARKSMIDFSPAADTKGIRSA